MICYWYVTPTSAIFTDTSVGLCMVLFNGAKTVSMVIFRGPFKIIHKTKIEKFCYSYLVVTGIMQIIIQWGKACIKKACKIKTSVTYSYLHYNTKSCLQGTILNKRDFPGKLEITTIWGHLWKYHLDMYRSIINIISEYHPNKIF